MTLVSKKLHCKGKHLKEQDGHHYSSYKCIFLQQFTNLQMPFCACISGLAAAEMQMLKREL